LLTLQPLLIVELKFYIMKKLILIVGVLFITHISFSQIFSWGIKGGINSSKISFDDFSVEGDQSFVTFTGVTPDASGNIIIPTITVDGKIMPDPVFLKDHMLINMPQVSFTPSSYEMGYHFGVFARIKVLALYIQPELIFSQTNASINVSSIDSLGASLQSTSGITYTNFDIPVLVGIKLGPLRLNAGPVATFKLSTNVDNATKEVLEGLDSFTAATKIATFGGQVGVGLDILKKVTIDVRYEFGLSKLGDNVTIGEHSFKTDQRQSQFIASIGWMF